ncbi:hypothetical protein EN745_14680 [Mesorhizobium sp. M4A.F.Ca.ET.022.05.2.1]|uniref:hypothetical protein n=1 Tax=Mesorhizobium sp. M4A.F.Ca.ET.022.05.2.1 TaxID=2496653 RepID=UPI000FCC15D5|nr:hypothetical protein [Mesorhizobium sp. M4A.F.Ca.ET.022.05.2.1]RVC79881.1 hypothetical protein EN745_14680 [Mesorhizobium sp. M4A.F.Ca.ET.022.05.2.1]
MDDIQRRRLERIAWNHAASTRNDEERWSFAFKTPGAVGYFFCPFSAVEEFDGDLEGLNLSWEPERVAQIEDGEDLTPEEFGEWRRAYRDQQVKAGADDVWPVWIVPIRLGGLIAAYATFLSQHDDPTLGGVHETIEQAEAVLSEQGALRRS